MITVLLVESPLAVRRALRARLSLEADLAIIGEADDALLAISLTRRLDPDVVVLDAEAPDLDAPAAARALADAARPRGIVVLSQRAAAVRLALAGTSAVVVGKHEGLAALVYAIQATSPHT